MAKERPILFSTPMVEAILEGRKNVTRRLTNLDLVNHMHFGQILGSWGLSEYHGIENGVSKWHIQTDVDDSKYMEFKCLYGEAGDVLWVRETWKKNDIPMGWPYHYKAANDTFTDPENEKWKPSIHMPKDASRIKLKNIGVRIERLHEITEGDIVREGIKPVVGVDLMELWMDLWVKINGKESWDSNPFVWVIEFKKL